MLTYAPKYRENTVVFLGTYYIFLLVVDKKFIT